MGIGFKSVKLRLQLGESGKMGLISGYVERTNLAMNPVLSLLRYLRNQYPKCQNKRRMIRSCFDRSAKVQGNSYYVVLVKANESNSLGRLVRSCLWLIDLPRPASPRSKECQSNSGNVVAFRPSLPWRWFGTWPIRVFRIEPNHGSVGFIGSRANDDKDCPRDAGQDVASRQEMHKSASSRSVRSGYWKARFCNAGWRPFCLPCSS